MMKLEDIKKLHQKKYRDEYGFFLLDGEHLILELERALPKLPALKNTRLLVTENYKSFPTPFDTQIISEKQMAQISETKSPQGIVAVVPLQAIQLAAAAHEKVIYLHEIQDPGNLGTILRTLAWFGGFRCWLSPNSVDPFNSKVLRASMGAIFHVPIELQVPLSQLKQFNQIACLDLAGAPLSSPDFAQADCYLFGNEARGVPTELLTHLPMRAFSIRGSGAIESLNLATAVNMCCYELKR